MTDELPPRKGTHTSMCMHMHALGTRYLEVKNLWFDVESNGLGAVGYVEPKAPHSGTCEIAKALGGDRLSYRKDNC